MLFALSSWNFSHGLSSQREGRLQLILSNCALWFKLILGLVLCFLLLNHWNVMYVACVKALVISLIKVVTIFFHHDVKYIWRNFKIQKDMVDDDIDFCLEVIVYLKFCKKRLEKWGNDTYREHHQKVVIKVKAWLFEGGDHCVTMFDETCVGRRLPIRWVIWSSRWWLTWVVLLILIICVVAF